MKNTFPKSSVPGTPLIELPESFFEKVYTIVRFIPSGRVTNYGAIGKFLSAASSSRMVGWAMNKAHQSENYVPAHRVVNRLGYLSGKHHFGSSNLMQQLLENEGIEVIDDKIINFSIHFWNPEMELIRKKNSVGYPIKSKL